MKVLYVKNGSERNKKFQLQTLIYEENGQKFVKKSALTKEALPHLHNMKENYEKLSQNIVNSKVKLAKIVASDEKSLTFEYIEGESFAKKLHRIRDNKALVEKFVQEYESFITNSFKTKKCTDGAISVHCREVFGEIEPEDFKDEICFDGVSNIDLIFSNIIEKKDEIYIIDYEWVFGCSLPVEYTLYRTFKYNFLQEYIKDHRYEKWEERFIQLYVHQNAFTQYRLQYLKPSLPVEEVLNIKEQQLQKKETQLQVQQEQLEQKESLLRQKEQQLQQKDQQIQQLHEIAQSMRLKNRIKSLFQFKKSEKV